MESDAAYFRRRASEERARALGFKAGPARKAHLEMAQRYDDLVEAMTARDYRLGLDLDAVTRPSA